MKQEKNDVSIVFQVNGKTVDHIKTSSGFSDGTLKAIAMGFSTVEDAIAGRRVLSVIVIPDKLVNVVTSSKEKEPSMKQKKIEGEDFKSKLEDLINRYSRENGSDTPDFILAHYLAGCLDNFDMALRAREKWYGRKVGDWREAKIMNEKIINENKKVFRSMQEFVNEYQPNSKLEIRVVPKDKSEMKEDENVRN